MSRACSAPLGREHPSLADTPAGSIARMVADAARLRAEFDRLADAGEWDKADEELSPAIDNAMKAIYAAPLESTAPPPCCAAL